MAGRRWGSVMRRKEESVALKFALKENLSLTLSNTKSTKTESVLYSSQPVSFKSEGESNEVTLTFKFKLGS